MKNRAQELLDGIIEFQHKLEDAKERLGRNKNVKEEYSQALTKVMAARQAIHGLVGTHVEKYQDFC